LFEELQNETNTLVPNIISAAVKRMEPPISRQIMSIAVEEEEVLIPIVQAPPPFASKWTNEHAEMIKMGFDNEQAESALEITAGNTVFSLFDFRKMR
jgi:hypothetical protein